MLEPLTSLTLRRHAGGFTAIELLTVVLIAAVLVLIAAPSFQALLDRQRVRAAISNLSTDVQYARSEAVRTNAAVTFSLSSATTPWCYGIATGTAACDCAAAGSCNLKSVSGSDFRNVAMTLGGGSGFTIDPRQGAIAPIAGGGAGAATSAVTFSSTSTSAAQARMQVNALGRTLLCAPGGTLGGYPTC